MKGKLSWTEIFVSFQGEGTRVGDPAVFVRFASCNLRCANCDTKYSAFKEYVQKPQWSTPGELLEEISARTSPRPARPNEFGEVERHWPNSVIFTGGEPLIQNQKLLAKVAAECRARGMFVTVETNGTRRPEYELAKFVDLWSVSPKPTTDVFVAPVATRTQPHVTFRPSVVADFCKIYRRLKRDVQVKFVVSGREEMEWLKDRLPKLKELSVFQVPLVLQPDNQTSTELKDYLCLLEALHKEVQNDPFWGQYNVRVIPQVHRILYGEKRGV